MIEATEFLSSINQSFGPLISSINSMDKSVLRPTQFDKDKVLLFRRTIQPISPSSGQVEDSVFLMRLGPGDPFKGESEQGPYLFLILDEEVVRGSTNYYWEEKPLTSKSIVERTQRPEFKHFRYYRGGRK